MSGLFTETFATANVKGAKLGMGQQLVREDLLALREEDPAVLALQEFWLPRYNQAARRVFRPDYRLATPWFKSPSLAWSTAFAVVGRPQLYPLHAAVWDGPRLVSDARQILAVTLQPRSHPGAAFLALSTHAVPGPWKSGKRMTAWENGRTALIDLIDRTVRSGRPVWGGADLNVDELAPLGSTIAGHTVRYVHHEIDYQFFIDSDLFAWTVYRTTKRLLVGHSDHKALLVDASLRRRV